MTKQELKWQVDDQQDQINELQKRIAILEARPYTIFTYPQPYVPLQAPYTLPSPGSTTTCSNESTQQERYGCK